MAKDRQIQVEFRPEAPSDLAIQPDPIWIKTRRELLAQIQAQVRERVGLESKSLIEYTQAYEKDIRGRWVISNKKELLGAVAKSDIVFGGDFHAFAQAQRTHLKILRTLKGARPLVLGLEAFSSKVQADLDRFIAGSIEEAELLKRSGWTDLWGFPWENYRPLILWARENGVRIVALRRGKQYKESSELSRRDKDAAQILLNERRKNPEALIYVLFGELHIARPHLPNEVRRLDASRKSRVLIIYLNPERMYFQLARRGLEATTDVVRVGNGRFCILSSPPWVQWQSYLMYLDKTSDRDLEEAEDHNFDHTDEIAAMIQITAADLRVSLKAIDDVSVFSASDSSLWSNLKNRLDKNELQIAKQLIANGRSFFIPKGGMFYLSRATINHAAELAGQYLHSKMSKCQHLYWNFPFDFRKRIWLEAVGFFMSKLINHKRQPDNLQDIQARVRLSGRTDKDRDALLLAIETRLNEMIFMFEGRIRRSKLRPRRRASYFESARILGGMMGERLYAAYRSRRISLKDLRHLLSRPLEEIEANYDEMLALLEMSPDLTKRKRERL